MENATTMECGICKKELVIGAAQASICGKCEKLVCSDCESKGFMCDAGFIKFFLCDACSPAEYVGRNAT